MYYTVITHKPTSTEYLTVSYMRQAKLALREALAQHFPSYIVKGDAGTAQELVGFADSEARNEYV